MSIQERIKLCILIHKVEEKKEYSEKLKLVNQSSFHGYPIKNMRGKR